LENLEVDEERSRLADEAAKVFMSISDEFVSLEEKFGKSMSLGKM